MSVVESRSAGLEPARVGWPAPRDTHPNHHLSKNGRRWWVAFTVHRGCRQERVRRSLGTHDLIEARLRRDDLLEVYSRAADLRVSLRFVPAREVSR
jgi:hypothetical protein